MQQWLENLVLTAVFPTLVSALDKRIDFIFWAFAGIALACGVALAILIKEKKSYVDLDRIDD